MTARRVVVACVLLLQATAASVAVADRYVMRVELDPGRARIAVFGVVHFETPTTPLRLSLGRGLSPAFQILGADSTATAWSVVDSTEDDFIWSASARGSVPAVRFRYDVSAPAPRFLFYVGNEFAFAEAGTHSWYPRRPDSRAHGEIEYAFPPDWALVSTGVRSDGAPGHCRFAADFASELWFVAAKFTSYRLDGPIPVTVYSASKDIHPGPLASQTARTLAALVRLFGRFPYPALSLIEVPPAVAEAAGGFNGIGASGAIAFETSFLQPFNLAHFAHELGHQWWGQSLSRSPESAGGDYMMDEAMTEYGALEVMESLEGPAKAEEYRRRDLPRPAGGGNYGAVEYLKLSAAGIDTALCCLPDRGTSYRLARSKGARAWYAIGQRVGPEKFHHALSRILERRAYENVTWEQFLSDLERELGPDGAAACRDWFEREGAPKWDVSWTQQRGRLAVMISQPDPAYHLQVELEVVTTRNTHARAMRLDGPVTRSEFAEGDTVLELRVDPRYRVIHWTPEYAAEAAALVPDTRARLMLQEGRAAEAETLLVHALGEVADPDVFAAEFLFASSLARFAEVRKDWKSAVELAERAIAAPTRRADVLPFTYLRLARVSARLDRWERAAFAARAALAADAAAGSLAGIAAESESLLVEARRH